MSARPQQRLVLPDLQNYTHRTLRCRAGITWSPGLRLVTPSPTSHHTAPSWPSTAEYAFRIVTRQGKRIGMANAGMGNFDQHFAFLRRSNINFNDFQRLAGPNATAARFHDVFPFVVRCVDLFLDKSAVNGRLPPSAQPADPGWSPRHQLIFEVNFNHFHQAIGSGRGGDCCKMAG